MSAEKACGKCARFWPLEKGIKGGKVIKLTRAYCLAKTIFPANRVGKHVYPPGAKVEPTPQARVIPTIVHKDQVVPNCPNFRALKKQVA